MPRVHRGERAQKESPTHPPGDCCLQSLASALVVLCLGAPSASLLIHKNFRMTQERGKFFEVPYARYAIAALHPAYILRQGGQAFLEARRTLVQDIEAARLKVIEVRRESKQTLF